MSEFSDSEFLFGGVKFNGGIDMGDGGGERDGDLGGDGNLGAGEGVWEVVERGIWGVEIFAYFAKQGELWERVEGELVLEGDPHIVVCPSFSLDL